MQNKLVLLMNPNNIVEKQNKLCDKSLADIQPNIQRSLVLAIETTNDSNGCCSNISSFLVHVVLNREHIAFACFVSRW